MMTHEDIDIPGLHVFVGPDHRMVAAHLDSGCGGVAVLIHSCQHVHIRSRTLIINIPFVFGNKRCWYVFHNRMVPVFYCKQGGVSTGDVIFVLNVTHKLRVPLPHRIAVKNTQ